MDNGSLQSRGTESKGAERHPRANLTQQARRQGRARIDYHPSTEAMATIRANMGDRYPFTVLSGVLDRIVLEWADDRGEGVKKPNKLPKALRNYSTLSTRARMTSDGRVRPCCGARTKAGTPCRAMPLPGRCRCKWHGGASTGPKTAEGRARALANLKQNRAAPGGV